ncbi:type II toxin-antitoxin system CcdA family antitoxin [Stenotrophomonas sp. SORGH_AS_0321]|uniref:type II toxin-antitoxin system CcdA family antitoxin n=1 Tax=Stenotrophomonas sp. SORGH_AS_0321 TaxID=3041787 RepID=UPI00285C10A9|nr:type II toxin-antitoxin system CcdA family antitoxin [Stenotrophomonas sp. SORGH_AS_0321]MDR6093533.1 antitoxin CcdA [Stenotrophomonas sp. SORGH_AS_0321]
MRMIDPETHMPAIYDPDAQRIGGNPTLNSDLVAQAKALTGNLSSKVEVLQTEFGASEHESPGGCRWELARAAEEWGAFVDAHGTLADEFSTL